MNFEKYTERSQGFIQSAQGLALRSNHQRFTPEHLLKVLLDEISTRTPYLKKRRSARAKVSNDAGPSGKTLEEGRHRLEQEPGREQDYGNPVA